MPYLAAIVLVVVMGVAAVFSFFSSDASAEKYENSILESEWSTTKKAEIRAPQIIHVKTTREYIVLAEPYEGDVRFTLLNPQDGKSVRTFPDNAYAPSRAAVKLAGSTLQASVDVVKQLSAQSN